MCRKFFDNYENFEEYGYPFGEDFLKGCFGNKYKRKYSMIGDGIYELIFWDNKIYDVELKKGKEMLINDNKKAFRDNDKDKIIEIIVNKLKSLNINYSVNSGKFITFQYNNFIFKLEIIKKAKMPE